MALFRSAHPKTTAAESEGIGHDNQVTCKIYFPVYFLRLRSFARLSHLIFSLASTAVLSICTPYIFSGIYKLAWLSDWRNTLSDLDALVQRSSTMPLVAAEHLKARDT
ncbi:hypothetical protein NXT3_PB00071 (plasmid) [Sinorhizobium fredii]|uniref:Uncharacterized protein n=1 Tax=Rhizobium fredii TaxID=380 RepID=A0A2L0HB75_RHIFR|nr:hypothetical protein NXT3_PB00071 [Sinorhizobium fredii]